MASGIKLSAIDMFGRQRPCSVYTALSADTYICMQATQRRACSHLHQPSATSSKRPAQAVDGSSLHEGSTRVRMESAGYHN
jgi:hypothetical protein